MPQPAPGQDLLAREDGGRADPRPRGRGCDRQSAGLDFCSLFNRPRQQPATAPEKQASASTGDGCQPTGAKLLDELGLGLTEIEDLSVDGAGIERDLLLAFGAESSLARPAAELFASLAESDGEHESEDDEEENTGVAAEEGGGDGVDEQVEASSVDPDASDKRVLLASLGVEEFGNWCFRSTTTGRLLGNIRRVGERSLKALCHAHKGCVCWVTIRTIEGECALERDLARWLAAAASGASRDDHASSSHALKIRYGMKPKPLRA